MRKFFWGEIKGNKSCLARSVFFLFGEFTQHQLLKWFSICAFEEGGRGRERKKRFFFFCACNDENTERESTHSIKAALE